MNHLNIKEGHPLYTEDTGVNAFKTQCRKLSSLTDPQINELLTVTFVDNETEVDGLALLKVLTYFNPKYLEERFSDLQDSELDSLKEFAKKPFNFLRSKIIKNELSEDEQKEYKDILEKIVESGVMTLEQEQKLRTIIEANDEYLSVFSESGRSVLQLCIQCGGTDAFFKFALDKYGSELALIGGDGAEDCFKLTARFNKPEIRKAILDYYRGADTVGLLTSSNNNLLTLANFVDRPLNLNSEGSQAEQQYDWKGFEFPKEQVREEANLKTRAQEAKRTLIHEVQVYLRSRFDDRREYKRNFGAFFNKTFMFSKKQKLDAAEALKNFLEDPNTKIPREHKKALEQGELGKLTKMITKSGIKLSFEDAPKKTHKR